MKKKRDPEMKGISRIDTKGTHGWYVRIYRAGRTYSKLYSDNKYGGTDKALEFAKKARKVAQEKLDSTIGTRSRRLVTHDKRNKSGIIGVSRTTKKTASGDVSLYYQVTWSPEKGKIKNRQWSVRKYGEEEAFRRAKEFRDSVMHEIYGEEYRQKVRERLAEKGVHMPDPDEVLPLGLREEL
ncbi:MAG: AP2 domain [Bacteroidetes bacterium HLUCCA01]|nr:MAG: AP2 domain [Bacteroidetes bacterium HLUCCA01]